MTEPKTTEVVDIAALARALVRQLIDVGAECQKARTFTVVPSDGPLRSVYDAYAEKLEERLREVFRPTEREDDDAR